MPLHELIKMPEKPRKAPDAFLVMEETKEESETEEETIRESKMPKADSILSQLHQQKNHSNTKSN